jgi:hypothetical protein
LIDEMYYGFRLSEEMSNYFSTQCEMRRYVRFILEQNA